MPYGARQTVGACQNGQWEYDFANGVDQGMATARSWPPFSTTR